MTELPFGKKIILFDGVCNLCNSAVQFVIRHDKKDEFRFTALQSEIGQEILSHIGIDQKNIDSIILYEPNVAYYYKSNAALEIAKCLGGFFSIAGIFRVIPEGLRNTVYNFVAKNRYKWFGKKDACMLPSTELQQKFL